MKQPSAATRYRKIKVGQIVRLKKRLENGGGDIFAEGTRMRVIRKHKGLTLETFGTGMCPACGLGVRRSISRIHMWDVDENATD